MQIHTSAIKVNIKTLLSHRIKWRLNNDLQPLMTAITLASVAAMWAYTFRISRHTIASNGVPGGFRSCRKLSWPGWTPACMNKKRSRNFIIKCIILNNCSRIYVPFPVLACLLVALLLLTLWLNQYHNVGP